MDIEHLADYLKNRPAELEKAKEQGKKVIGYFPGNYVPEEIIYASGAVPICLNGGGTLELANKGLSVVPHLICPFARGQIGERLLKTNPYYNMMDMLVAPITCQHLKKVAEVWEYYGDLEIFKLGIPHQYDYDFQVEYFIERLKALKDKLQAFTGNEVTGEKISEAIDLYNKMRGLLRKISLLRNYPESRISALDFIRLNHASYYADPAFMVDLLESVYKKLSNKKQIAYNNYPRILLVGPSIANGDYTVIEMIKEAGGEIVIEEICEGVRYYWRDIEKKGDAFESLSRGYLVDRVPCAYMVDSNKKRLDFTLKLIEDYKINGVIWYELMYCETYDSESYFFAQKLGERDIPMLILESDYGTADTGQMKTRMQAFIEIIKGAYGNV
jgi:benzoyl-CoA reductase/2-hydroxyglutaryl-CoA dehydratase subunit BcrC/BadD/HgdB